MKHVFFVATLLLTAASTALGHSTYEHADHAKGVPHGGADTLYPEHSEEHLYEVPGEGGYQRYALHTHTLREHKHDGIDFPVESPIVSDPQPEVTEPEVSTVNSGGENSVESPVTSDDTEQEDPAPTPAINQGLSITQPQISRRTSPTLLPIRVTEYMLRDWSNRVSNLPQWIEFYNPNQKSLDLTGYKFYYAQFNHSIRVYEVAETPVTVSIVAPANGVVILATHKAMARNRVQEEVVGGISEDAVFILNIDNVLKSGWRIVDPDGDIVHEIGMVFTDGRVGNPVFPPHVQRMRQSYNRLASETPKEPHFYGNSEDIGSPGFFAELAPKAPAALKPKKIGIWADLKQ